MDPVQQKDICVEPEMGQARGQIPAPDWEKVQNAQLKIQQMHLATRSREEAAKLATAIIVARNGQGNFLDLAQQIAGFIMPESVFDFGALQELRKSGGY